MPKVTARHGQEEVHVLHVAGAVEAEQPADVGDLRLGGGLIHQEAGGVTGEAHQEEDHGDHAPDHEDGVQQAAEQERKAPSSLLQCHAAEVHVQLGRGTNRSTRAAVRVHLDLLVERHDRRPVAHLALQLGEQCRRLASHLALGGLVELEQVRRVRRPVDQADGRPVAHVVVRIQVVAGTAGREAAVGGKVPLFRVWSRVPKSTGLMRHLHADRLEHLRHRRRHLVERLAVVLGGNRSSRVSGSPSLSSHASPLVSFQPASARRALARLDRKA